jgi:hypothetical protein
MLAGVIRRALLPAALLPGSADGRVRQRRSRHGGVPFDEQRHRDAQHEYVRLLRVPRPPGARCGGGECRACPNGGSVQLEFTLAGVWAGHRAVQHTARITAQVGGFPGPGNGADKQLAAREAGLDRADPSEPSGRTVPSIATGTAASPAMPRRAISGAPCSRSRQHAKSAAPVTAATVLLAERMSRTTSRKARRPP